MLVELKNLMAWDSCRVELPRSVGLVMGEMGSGKSCLIRAVYAALTYAITGDAEEVICDTWDLPREEVGSLVRARSGRASVKLLEPKDGFSVVIEISEEGSVSGAVEGEPSFEACLLVPSRASRILRDYVLGFLPRLPGTLLRVAEEIARGIDVKWSNRVSEVFLEELRSATGEEEVELPAQPVLSPETIISEVVASKPIGRLKLWQASLGQVDLALLQALAVVMKPNSVVLFEEVEGGMHPALQFAAFRALARLAIERQATVMATTHSEHVLLAVASLVRDGILSAGNSKVYYTKLENGAARIVEAHIVEGEGVLEPPPKMLELAYKEYSSILSP